MKKRLIKKAYKKAILGITTRIKPKGYHGKAIAIFDEFVLIGEFKNTIKRSKDPSEIIMHSCAIGATLVRVQMIQSQPIKPKHFKSGCIAFHETGEEMIIDRKGNQIQT